MGGGFFDNMWDPYSGAYGYPRTQGRYYRPQAPAYERRPFYEQQNPAYGERRGVSRVQPEDHLEVEEPVSRMSVRTIPVTDGDVKAAQRVEVARSVVRFASEDAAATKIQAVYRGYAVRKTAPLKHLRVIVKVKEEFEVCKRKLQEKEQRTKLCSDPKERLRWTEGIMALLLRLDQLQGVHPEVRLIRKAAAKELLMFQEKLDSMSDVSEEEDNVGGDDAVAAGASVEEDSVAEESSEVGDAAGEEAAATDGDTKLPPAEAVEDSMEVEELVSNVEDSRESPQSEAVDGTISAADDEHQQTTMEQDSVPAEESNASGHNDSNVTKIIEMETFEQSGSPHGECEENAVASPADAIAEGRAAEDDQSLESGFVQAAAQVSMDVEKEASTMVPACDSEEVSVQTDFSPLVTVPPTDVEGYRGESFGALDDFVEMTPPIDEPVSKEARLKDFSEKADVMEGDEVVGYAGDDACTCTMERVRDAGSLDIDDKRMIRACSMSLEPKWSAKSLQVGQPQISTAGDISSLSDRALLEQLLEENRRLRDVVGKVLHWGKQQNDIIHSLAGRIEQLEEHQPHANMLHGGKDNGRKRICHDGALAAGEKERSRSKGRRKGRQSSRPQLGYLDSEWMSPDSEEYF